MDETSLSLIKCPISHPQAASRFTCEREERASGLGEGEGEGGARLLTLLSSQRSRL